MNSADFAFFHLTLVHTEAAFLDLGQPPLLLLAAHGAILPEGMGRAGAPSGALLCALRSFEGPTLTRTAPLSRDEVGRIALALRDLGLPEQAPQLDGVVDTSDSSCTTHLAGGCSDAAGHSRPFQVTLTQMASGYRGPSAPAFAALARVLLTLGAVPEGDASVWQALVRSRGPGAC